MKTVADSSVIIFEVSAMRILRFVFFVSAIASMSAHAQRSAPPEADVNIVNTPNVVVANGPTEPVPVTVTDEPGSRELFQALESDGTNSFLLIATFDTVPVGKRMIVEHVSANVTARTDRDIQAPGCSIRLTEPGNQSNLMAHRIVMSPHQGLSGIDPAGFSGSNPTLIFADAGQNIGVVCSFPADTPIQSIMVAGISGYFVDM